MADQAARNPVLARILAELGAARDVLDVGCGAGTLARALVHRGYAVTGLDPQGTAIAAARAAVPEARFVVASAADRVFAKGNFDAVVFLNSLHHVSVQEMMLALGEAARSLRQNGCMIVVEPLAEGPLFDVLRPVDDETEVRAKAQAALDHCGLSPRTDLVFERIATYPDFDGFVSSLIAVDPTRAPRIARERASMAADFDVRATPLEDGYALAQPMRLRSFVAD